MFNITKVGAWAGAIISVIVLCGLALTGAKWLIAQEAQKQLAPVQQQVEQTNERLDDILKQNREGQDWDKTVYCLEKQHQDETPEERERLCKEESEARWDAWDEEDDKTDPDG